MLYPICGYIGRFENWSVDAKESIEEAVEAAEAYHRCRHSVRNRYGSRPYRSVRHDVRDICRICVVRRVPRAVPRSGVRRHREGVAQYHEGGRVRRELPHGNRDARRIRPRPVPRFGSPFRRGCGRHDFLPDRRAVPVVRSREEPQIDCRPARHSTGLCERR